MKAPKNKHLTRYGAIKLADERTNIARGALREALAQSKYAEHLARIVMVFAAEAGGHLAIPQDRLDLLPENAELLESYDKDTNTVLLRCVVPTPPAAPDTSAEPGSAGIAT